MAKNVINLIWHPIYTTRMNTLVMNILIYAVVQKMNSGICGTNKCDLSIHSIELEMSHSHFITLINSYFIARTLTAQNQVFTGPSVRKIVLRVENGYFLILQLRIQKKIFDRKSKKFWIKSERFCWSRKWSGVLLDWAWYSKNLLIDSGKIGTRLERKFESCGHLIP